MNYLNLFKKLLVVLIILISSSTSFGKDLKSLIFYLENAGNLGKDINFDEAAKMYGFKSFKNAVNHYKKTFGVKINVEEAKNAFIGLDQSVIINYSDKNFQRLYNIITQSKYQGSKRYRNGYLKDKRANNAKYKGFVISIDLERELYKLTLNPDLEKIAPFTWTWAWHNDEYRLKKDLIRFCKESILKYKIPNNQKCLIIDINETNSISEGLEFIKLSEVGYVRSNR